jgi:ribosome maturation factor RimP
VSRLVSPILDVADPIEISYALEISSPGVNRPLVGLDDFVRFAGERVKITTHYLHQDRRRFKGELVGVEEDVVLVRIDGDTYRIPHADIKKAHLAPLL